MKETDNVLRILQETRDAIEIDNSAIIKDLSNQTINTASLTQDPDNIAVAVIVYALSKIYERKDYRNLPGWGKANSLVKGALDKSIMDLKKNDENKFRKDFEEIRIALEKLSGRLKDYVADVFRKAQVNKASRLYEHGISMESTAKLLGVTMFELAEYAGQTGISEVHGTQTMDVKQRIKIAEGMFK
jgi:hypothetical protein